MWEILLPIFGLLVGILATMTGVGGGTIIVPLLSLLYAFTPASAVGTSLASIVFTATAATVTYWRQKRIYVRTGLILALATSPGAVIGAYLTTVFSPAILGVIFGFFLIIVAIKILSEVYSNKTGLNREVEARISEDDLLTYKRSKIYLAVPLGFASGIISGLLGVGGGIVLVPLIMFILQLDIHIAVATSMLTMVFTSISGVTQHLFLGNVNFEYAVILGVGSIIGTQIGAYIYKRTSNTTLRGVFAVILIAISIGMIIKFL